MPNYLAAAQSVSNAVTAGQNFDVTGQQLETAGINAGLSAVTALASGQDPFAAAFNAGVGSIPGASTIATGVGAVGSALGIPGLGGIGGLGGTKPMALHTEYASGGANWSKPYGMGTDIIFYLQRAGGGGPSASGAPAAAGTGILPNAIGGSSPSLNPNLPTPIGGGVQPVAVAAHVQAGPGLPDDMQSPLNQVAVASHLRGAVPEAQTANVGLAGPMTGLIENLVVQPGATTSTSVQTSSLPASVRNVLDTGQSFAKTSTSSAAASEVFFSETLSNTFNPGISESIEDALTRAPVSELSSQMAKFSGGVTSTKDFIEAINYSRIGYTTQESGASTKRLGPQGLSQRTKK